MPEETLTIWKLYDNTELTREKNREVEDLENWLEGNFVYRQHSHGQYFKHALNKTLKINADQRILDFFTETNNIDYASVKNPDDSYPVYYFVTAKRWIAEKTIELTLLMDTINTFKNNYTLSEKTTINREHENRFFVNSGGYMRRLVDKVDEGIQPQLYKTVTTNVWNETPPLENYELKDTSKFYLFYANTYSKDPEDKQNPLNGFGCYKTEKRFVTRYAKYISSFDTPIGQSNCWIIDPVQLGVLGLDPIITSKEGARVGVEFLTTITNRIDPSGIEWKIFGILLNQYQTQQKVRIPTYFDGTYYWTGAIFYDNGKWRVQEVRIEYLTGDIQKGAIWEVSNGDAYLFSRTDRYEKKVSYYQLTKTAYGTLTNYYLSATTADYTLNYQLETIGALKTLDRTDARLQKLFELPYDPEEFPEVEVSDVLYPSLIDTNFERGEFGNVKYLQLAVLNAEFKNTLKHADPIRFMKEDYEKAPAANQTANIKNESKLFNSAFWLSKFVYDSFSYNFNYEQADDWSEVTIDFIPTSTMNSKWAFIFNWDKKNEKEDFGKVLLVSRNNELPIYNSDYLDYVRSSYNYEKKLRESQMTLQLANGAISIGAGAASAALGSGLSGSIGVGLAAQGLQTVMGAVSSRLLSEQAQEQKMEQLKNQKTQVLGGDDIDLLNAYCGNKAQILRYQASSEMRNMLYELFRFYGYKTNKRGNPRDFTTNGNKRYWYNFIQCEPVFDSTSNISDECLKDIENRYKEGITIFHKRNGDYNFSQNYENWEEDLIGHQEPQDDPLDDLMEDVGTVGAGSGEWTLTPPVYGFSGNAMGGGQTFMFIECMGSTSDPTYNFTAQDGFGNTYQFIPAAGAFKVIMTRQLDGRTFEKAFTVNKLYKLTTALTTTSVPWVTQIAEPYRYALAATKNA